VLLIGSAKLLRAALNRSDGEQRHNQPVRKSFRTKGVQRDSDRKPVPEARFSAARHAAQRRQTGREQVREALLPSAGKGSRAVIAAKSRRGSAKK
jgi:hypothetical protein